MSGHAFWQTLWPHQTLSFPTSKVKVWPLCQLWTGENRPGTGRMLHVAAVWRSPLSVCTHILGGNQGHLIAGSHPSLASCLPLPARKCIFIVTQNQIVIVKLVCGVTSVHELCYPLGFHGFCLWYKCTCNIWENANLFKLPPLKDTKSLRFYFVVYRNPQPFY